MALIVTLNTRITSSTLGCIQGNGSYWDPLTKTNLFKGSPQSADLTSFSNSQLINISNAVYSGRLSIVSGSMAASGVTASAGQLPYHTDSAMDYNTYQQQGVAGGAGWTGVTGVAAADALGHSNF